MSNKPKHDIPMIVVLTGLTIFLICVMFWMVLSTEISSGIRWVRVGQLTLGSLFTDKFDVLIRQLKALEPSQISPFYLAKMTEATNSMLRVPLVILSLIMAVTCFFKKTTHPYVRKLDLEKMINEHAGVFPVTRPILRFNPLVSNSRTPGSAIPDKLPPFAEALSPEEWITHNGIAVRDGRVDVAATRRALVKQLGGRWKGPDALPVHLKALYAAFALKAAGRRLESDDFLGEIAMHWQPAKGLVLPMDVRGRLKKYMADPDIGRVMEKLAAQHAFVSTAMLRCLHVARENGGVLAPAQFLWLRATDRTLWYPLNNLGRGAVHAEAAGAMAHYRAERAAQKPIPNPQVDSAIDGINHYLRDSDLMQVAARA